MSKYQSNLVSRISGPEGGTVSALAYAQGLGFAGTGVGLYRSRDCHHWERLPNAPINILSLVVSPSFFKDHTLFAGTVNGIYFSKDLGEYWQAAQVPLTGSVILALSYSPQATHDGILLAGTLEDGILYSDSHGERWESRNFGLLDQAVYSLAFSPDFLQDGMAFVGSDTALYYSYNHARAWKELSFPVDAPPVLSLAVSPEFVSDQTLYAGTEQQGLLRSTDRGKSWQRLAFSATSVNNLLFTPDGGLLAATNAGLYQSYDQGETWICLVDIPNALSLAASGDMKIAGWVEQGIWIKAGELRWLPVRSLSARSFIKAIFSPRYTEDGVAFFIELPIGLWRTTDGGTTWDCVSESLPGETFNDLAFLSPGGNLQEVLLTTSQGIWCSQDLGNTWELYKEGIAEAVRMSRSGQILTVGFPHQGIIYRKDQHESWQQLPGPWEKGGKILDLAVTDKAYFYVAYLEGIGETLSFWQGRPGEMSEAFRLPAGDAPFVAIYIPAEPTADRPWYASLSGQVWKFSSRRSGSKSHVSIQVEPGQNEEIVTLTGFQKVRTLILYACTGKSLYQSVDEGRTWSVIYDFGNDRVVALSLASSFADDSIAFALLLGGSLLKLKL